ncbi:unnamed protein product [Schistosoma mattheei]|uniref:Dynein light chain n=1 Tax=Schistosoma mattheei TaxID=31246 RepID=A0AA85BBC7_9TREM|nr:unnamed protein product [Schistosoma mattheei]
MTLDKPIAVVKYVDMPVDMQQDAVDLCYQGIENFKEEYEIAKYLKKEYECKYGNIWHCIVGKSFVTSHMKKMDLYSFIYTDIM